MKLNELADNEGATKKRMRVGRGVGSGKGKTAGRGVKGQSSRGGVAINGFEGGQMPVHMRMPKRGFNKPNAKEYAWVNLSRIAKAIESGALDPKATIDEAVLVSSGVVRRSRDGIRLLAKGTVETALTIVVTGASAPAIAAVAAAGGSVTVTAKPKVKETAEAAA
jgi:large subunit ribosomal protein L15